LILLFPMSPFFYTPFDSPTHILHGYVKLAQNKKERVRRWRCPP
jgi:hypothetical protein